MDTLKFFRQFKLGNSVFNGNFQIDKCQIEISKIPAEEIERRSIRHMVDDLSNFIISKNQSAIFKKENEQEINYKCELLILKVEDFKTIVEAAIQMMPIDAIDKIREGKPEQPIYAERPPLGLLPEIFWLEGRLKDVEAVITRYAEALKEIPSEWIEERYQLRNKIQNIQTHK